MVKFNSASRLFSINKNILLTQTDTTVGFLSQDAARLCDIKSRTSTKPFIKVYKTFKEKNGNIVVFGANDVISDVFRAVHFSHHIPEYQNRGDFIHQKFQ